MYFSLKKKRWAIDDLNTIHECADKAGIRKSLFVDFGLLLGIIRERDFIGHDNDIDMCIKAEEINKSQEEAYFDALIEAGMFFARKKFTRRVDTGRLTWFSLRKAHDHAKFCHWLMFPWRGFYWHSKGGMWVSNRKFNHEQWQYKKSDQAIMKGIPEEYLKELIDVDFRGVKIQIPKLFGSCLDYMYPGWRVPRQGGSSAKTTIAIVPKWDDESTWKIQHSY